tara:strand:+ start:771 stop:956 length:186 start_codon:yes stop_codon:yes gene_type:complete
MYTDMFEIQDNNGVIHSGAREEMELAFEVMCHPSSATKEQREQYLIEWDGDLKLVQIHNVC